jgi:hypothetical protein
MADHQEQIRRLRAKAASTTFPHEAQACRDKADLLDAKYGDHFAHIGEPDIQDWARDTLARVRRAQEENAARIRAEQERWMREREMADRLSAMGFIRRVHAGFDVTGTTSTGGSSQTTWGQPNVIIMVDGQVIQA